MDAGNDFVPAEILPITVEVSRSYSHVHEGIVGIYTHDAVSTVAVLFDGSETSARNIGISYDGLEGSLFPIDAGSGKVVFEAVPENLEQFARPPIAYRLVAEHSFKLHCCTHIIWRGDNTKNGMRSEEDASLIGYCALNLRHDDGDSNVLQFAGITLHVGTDSLDVLCRCVQLALVGTVTIAQKCTKV